MKRNVMKWKYIIFILKWNEVKWNEPNGVNRLCKNDCGNIFRLQQGQKTIFDTRIIGQVREGLFCIM